MAMGEYDICGGTGTATFVAGSENASAICTACSCGVVGGGASHVHSSQNVGASVKRASGPSVP